MARLLRFRERLVEVLDLERQVVEPLSHDVVRREAGPFLVVVQLEDESVVLGREVGRDPFRRVNRASSQVLHAEDLRVERNGGVEVLHANPCVRELRLHGLVDRTAPLRISDTPSNVGCTGAPARATGGGSGRTSAFDPGSVPCTAGISRATDDIVCPMYARGDGASG